MQRICYQTVGLRESVSKNEYKSDYALIARPQVKEYGVS